MKCVQGKCACVGGGKVWKIAILEEGLVVESQPPCLQGSLLVAFVIENNY